MVARIEFTLYHLGASWPSSPLPTLALVSVHKVPFYSLVGGMLNSGVPVYEHSFVCLCVCVCVLLLYRRRYLACGYTQIALGTSVSPNTQLVGEALISLYGDTCSEAIGYRLRFSDSRSPPSQTFVHISALHLQSTPITSWLRLRPGSPPTILRRELEKAFCETHWISKDTNNTET